eukprot:9647994-Alexandrium_andersonii.AAC.1
MSASLVGSEMCIRDRQRETKRAGARHYKAAQDIAKRRIAKQRQSAQSNARHRKATRDSARRCKALQSSARHRKASHRKAR